MMSAVYVPERDADRFTGFCAVCRRHLREHVEGKSCPVTSCMDCFELPRGRECGRCSMKRERDEAIEGLRDLIETAEDMLPYVPTYFMVKWGHDGGVNRAKAVLANLNGGGDEQAH